jgi:hypothetical protein
MLLCLEIYLWGVIKMIQTMQRRLNQGIDKRRIHGKILLSAFEMIYDNF